MTVLLDSHAFVWWLLDDKRLSLSAFGAIEQDPEVYVSAVTAWEIAGKVRTGKWPQAEILSERFFDTISQYQLRPLPISLNMHTWRARCRAFIAIRSTACSRRRRSLRTCRWSPPIRRSRILRCRWCGEPHSP